MVFEEDRVHAELRVDQRHVTKPPGKGVDALLPLNEVFWVGPGYALWDLARQDTVNQRSALKNGS